MGITGKITRLRELVATRHIRETRDFCAYRIPFFRSKVRPYTYQQLYEITARLLDIPGDMARLIVDPVWSTSKDTRDCVRISRLAKTVEDVKSVIENFISYGDWKQR